MMNELNNTMNNDIKTTKELLSGSGYSDKAIRYYLDKKNMGVLPDANQVSELTGHCGDTMKISLKIEEEIIRDARIQVLGCPGAIAAAMAAMDMIKGKTLDEALKVTDRDIFRELEEIPDQKQHCIRLTNKTIEKAIDDFRSGNGGNLIGE
ncbi:iron-sulfur cluster assembly scaffold protein [Thermodesulfobacteriota bacterium]